MNSNASDLENLENATNEFNRKDTQAFLALAKKRMLTYDDKEKVFGLVINPTMVKLMYGYVSTAVVGVVLGILK